MPLRNGYDGQAMRETLSAPPQPRAIYQRPLKTTSAPPIQEEGPQGSLPFDSVFPANPWKRPDGEAEGTSSLDVLLQAQKKRIGPLYISVCTMLLPRVALPATAEEID